jgi:hypothetical protein
MATSRHVRSSTASITAVGSASASIKPAKTVNIGCLEINSR